MPGLARVLDLLRYLHLFWWHSSNGRKLSIARVCNMQFMQSGTLPQRHELSSLERCLLSIRIPVAEPDSHPKPWLHLQVMFLFGWNRSWWSQLPVPGGSGVHILQCQPLLRGNFVRCKGVYLLGWHSGIWISVLYFRSQVHILQRESLPQWNFMRCKGVYLLGWHGSLWIGMLKH